ncbi:hypothetical protein D3C74_341990 [compost metagenome]
MIDMLDMTDQQLNKELAILMGYKVVAHDHYRHQLIAPEGCSSKYLEVTEMEAWRGAPNYCLNPAASLEVQAVAINKDEEGYIRNWLLNKHGKSVMAFTAVSLRTAAEIANSSPRERAEAAYMTLSSQDLHPLREDI